MSGVGTELEMELLDNPNPFCTLKTSQPSTTNESFLRILRNAKSGDSQLSESELSDLLTADRKTHSVNPGTKPLPWDPRRQPLLSA